jgi:ubiquinone/menaquinone biosynthesis C-methylase UbiE
MKNAGFRNVSWRSLSFGVAAIHIGQRAAVGDNGAG